MPFNNIPGVDMGNMGGMSSNFSDNWKEMQRANQLKRAQEFQNKLSEANDSRRFGLSGMYESEQPGLINLQRGGYSNMGGGFGGLIPPSPQPQMPQRVGGDTDFEDLLNQLNTYRDNMG
tara:strand:- start:1688 stop:2044 length:357 start_codon:yes stop_codon:yes gene_type:complete